MSGGKGVRAVELAGERLTSGAQGELCARLLRPGSGANGRARYAALLSLARVRLQVGSALAGPNRRSGLRAGGGRWAGLGLLLV